MRNMNETYQKPEILDLGNVVELTGECSEGCGFDNILQTGFVKDDGGSIETALVDSC